MRFGQAGYRTGSFQLHFWYAIILNCICLGIPVSIYIVILYLLQIILILYEKIRYKKVPKVFFQNILIGGIGLAPIVWYSVIREHSLGHAYFTYRNLLITCICAQIMGIRILDKYIKESKKEAFIIFILIDLIVLILNNMI